MLNGYFFSGIAVCFAENWKLLLARTLLPFLLCVFIKNCCVKNLDSFGRKVGQARKQVATILSFVILLPSRTFNVAGKSFHFSAVFLLVFLVFRSFIKSSIWPPGFR